MKQYDGFWIPDWEENIQKFLAKGPTFKGKPTYQLAKYGWCLPFVKQFRHAVDAGAHCGLWTSVMLCHFAKVTAFEPVPAHFECLQRNVVSEKATLENVALSDRQRSLRLRERGLKSKVVQDKALAMLVGARTLDSYSLKDVDFLKIDVEGYELNVIHGAAQTIKSCRPCICVEQKHDTGAVQLLRSWGAELQVEYNGDYILAWNS